MEGMRGKVMKKSAGRQCTLTPPGKYDEWIRVMTAIRSGAAIFIFLVFRNRNPKGTAPFTPAVLQCRQPSG